MAVGQTNFTTKGKEAFKFDDTPPPAQEWEAKILGKQAQVQKASATNPDSVSYVSAMVELLGSAPNENSKNRKLFISLYTKTDPMEGSGRAIWEKSDQFLGLAQALGEEVDFGAHIKTVRSQSGKEWAIIDPLWLKQWLMNQDGKVIKLVSKVKAANPAKGYKARGEVDFFIAADPSALGNLEDEGPDPEGGLPGGDGDAPSEETEAANEDEVQEEAAPEPEEVKPASAKNAAKNKTASAGKRKR